MLQREHMLRYACDELSALADHPFQQDDDSTVFRHPVSRKWLAIIMTVPRSRIGLPDDSPVALMNIKCDPIMLDILLGKPGFYRAWHMNKLHWITAVLDDTIPDDELKPLLCMAFSLVEPKARKTKNKETGT